MFTKLAILLAAPVVLAAQQTSETYRPISLQEAIRLVRENNVAAITSANTIRTASNSVRAARAQLFPTVNASAGQNKSAGERPGQNGQNVPYTSAWSYSTGLSANFNLYDGGRTFSEIRRTEADVNARETDQVTTLAGLSFQVKTQYNAVLSANEQETAARGQLALAEQQMKVSIARVNAGAANVVDSLNSVVQIGTAQLAILNAQQNLRTASAQLTRLVGTPYLVTAVAADTADVPHSPIDSAAIMQMALEGPAIRSMQAQLASNQAQQRSARAAYLPTLSANVGFGGNGTSNVYGFGGPNPYAYNRSIGFNVGYPIFNRFTRENQVQAAQIALDNTQAQLKDQRFAAQQTVIVQLGALRNAEEQMRVQQISVRASEEALRVNQQRYAAGVATLLDVLQSQSTLIISRNQLIQARLTYRNARAQLEQVIGRDLP